MEKLLRLMEVTDDDNLPCICHELVARKKGVSKRMLLQQAYDLTKNELNLHQLIALPSHIIDKESWDLFGASVDALGTDMLPFSVIPPDSLSKEAQKAIAEDLDQARQHHMSGENVQGVMSATNAKKMCTSKGCVPQEWAELEVQLELHAVVLATVLGSQHKVVTAHMAAFHPHRNMWASYMQPWIWNLGAS